jgi:general secretion pathway protein J
MTRVRGFTLIEVLLATVLLAAGLALAFATLRAATVAAQRGEAIAQHSERMRAVAQFLRRRLVGARPVGFALDPDTGLPSRFIGEPERIRFVADLPDYLGRGGPYLHDLRVVDGVDGKQLQVDFTLVLAGEAVAEADPRAPELLASRLQGARFRYRALDAQNRLGAWETRWPYGDRLPLQVEINLRDRDGRAWPPLLVALPLAGAVPAPIGAGQ